MLEEDLGRGDEGEDQRKPLQLRVKDGDLTLGSALYLAEGVNYLRSEVILSSGRRREVVNRARSRDLREGAIAKEAGAGENLPRFSISVLLLPTRLDGKQIACCQHILVFPPADAYAPTRQPPTDPNPCPTNKQADRQTDNIHTSRR
jgi:hypothetical protein